MDYRKLKYFFGAGVVINLAIAIILFTIKDILVFILGFLFLSVVIIDIGLVILFIALEKKDKVPTIEQKLLTVGNISALCSGVVFLYFLVILWIG